MRGLNTNYVLADFICSMNRGMIRGMRSIKIRKTYLSIRMLSLLYKQGVLRGYKIRTDHLLVYFRFIRSRHIIRKLTVVSNLVQGSIEL